MNELVTKLKWNEGAEPNYIQIPSEGGLYIPFGTDQKMILVFRDNGVGSEIIIKAGTGIQATDDIVIVPPEETTHGIAVVVLESGKFVITEGEHKGCVHLVDKEKIGATMVAAIELP